MLGLIKRTFVVKTPEAMSNLYKTLHGFSVSDVELCPFS